jgi:hypothetical protein
MNGEHYHGASLLFELWMRGAARLPMIMLAPFPVCMAKPYSEDLPERVVAAVEGGPVAAASC